MKSNKKFFKKSKCLPVDKFFQNVLYDKKNGYYNLKLPIGSKGDFVTSPKISNLFSEMIAVWIVSAWEVLGRPKKINIVELGPGDGGLAKIILEVFKRFPEFEASENANSAPAAISGVRDSIGPVNPRIIPTLTFFA